MRICHRIFRTKAVALDANSICLAAPKLSFSKQKPERPTSVLARTPARAASQEGAVSMMCNNFCVSVLQLSRSTFLFYSPHPTPTPHHHFYVFTVGDKAPTGFTIMLCRCSQQERVIAVGVWGSPRRFGSSGQSCQELPEDSAGCARLLLPSAGRLFVCPFILHVLQIARVQHVHLFAATLGAPARISFACQLTTASSRPAGSVTAAVAFPGPVSAITRALQDPGKRLRARAAAPR